MFSFLSSNNTPGRVSGHFYPFCEICCGASFEIISGRNKGGGGGGQGVEVSSKYGIKYIVYKHAFPQIPDSRFFHTPDKPTFKQRPGWLFTFFKCGVSNLTK